MIIFGGVPISVFIPPKIDANAKGIRNFPACHPIFWQVDRVIGSRRAIAPILLMNDERMAAMNIIRNKNWVSLGENLPIIFPVTAYNPASCRPLLINKTNATVITAMVPLANMFGYINSLRSMSQGRAQYSMFFDHYSKVPQNVQDEVTKKIAG